MNGDEYINFPVSLLEGFLKDHKAALMKILHYAGGRVQADKKQAHAGITKNTILDFMRKTKTDTDIAALCAYLAIKSIIGNREYAQITNKELVLHRMAGHNGTSGAPLPTEVELWGTRRKWERLKYELKVRYGVVFYWDHFRGIYVSTRLSLGDLTKAVVAKRASTKKAMLKKMENSEIEQAFLEMGQCTTKLSGSVQ